MRRLLAPIPIAVLCAVVALVALLAYGLASNEPDRGVEDALARRRARAGARRRAAAAVGRRQRLARRLPRQGRGAQLLGLLVRPLPRGVAAAPALARAPRASDDATVLGVDVQDVSGDARDFVDEYGLTYPMLRDGAGDLRDEFGILGLPETFVIDRQGRIAAVRARPGRRRVHARAGRPAAAGARVRRAAALAALLAALALPAAALAQTARGPRSATSRTR